MIAGMRWSRREGWKEGGKGGRRERRERGSFARGTEVRVATGKKHHRIYEMVHFLISSRKTFRCYCTVQ